MSWSEIDTWIVVTGVLCAMACALPGCFLVLRKMSMMGDAISHAVLPGIAIAFLVSGSRAGLPMFLGAVVTAVLTTVLIQWIDRHANVDRGAAMGVVFTTFFAVGLLIIVHAADRVDLDPGCVLYGAIEFTPLDRVSIGGAEIPAAALVNGGALLINAGLITLFYKEMRLSAFDPDLAETLGFSSGFLHYLLMTMVAMTTVAAFESVGSILVIAMLIVPAACAQLVTQRLFTMLMVALACAAGSAVFGHLGAIHVPRWIGFEATNTSGMMAVAAGAIFAIMLFAALIRRRAAARAISAPEEKPLAET